MNQQTQADRDRVTGIAGLAFTRQDKNTPLFQRLVAALHEELALMRAQNDVPANIVDTTVLRGEISLVKRILARTDEVGPESRTSEPEWPESSPRAF